MTTIDFNRELVADLESGGARRRAALDRVFEFLASNYPDRAASVALQLLRGASALPEPPPGPQWETMQQAANRSNFSIDTLQRAIARGELRVCNPTGGRNGKRIKVSDLEAWMDR